MSTDQPPTTTSLLPPSALTSPSPPCFLSSSPEAAGCFLWKGCLMWPGLHQSPPAGAAPSLSALPRQDPRDPGVCARFLWPRYSSIPADHGPLLDDFVFTCKKMLISLQSREMWFKRHGDRFNSARGKSCGRHIPADGIGRKGHFGSVIFLPKPPTPGSS